MQMKRIISGLLIFIMLLSVVAFSGCSKEKAIDLDSVENTLKVYFSAVNGFNLGAMADFVEGEDGNEDDVGFSTENISDEYAQTQKYKRSIKDMCTSLAKTLKFTIESKESTDDGKVEFSVKIKYADVEEGPMNEYVNAKVDEYVERNPYFFAMNEIQQNDTAIKVMAQAYDEYLEITEKLEKDFTITMSDETGSFKIHTEQNKEFFEFLADLFG